jgi:hypothetical protein
MGANTSVIDIFVELTDNTGPGAESSKRNVTKLEQSMQKAQESVNRLGKVRKIEITMQAIDKASRGIDSVFRKGASFAGSVFSATISIVDRVTAPIRGMISRVGDLIGITSIASAALGGLTVHNALSASAAQARADTQLTTVLRNMNPYGDWREDFLAIQRHADDLQRRTMFGNTSLMAGAGELATYLTDPEAILKAMNVLVDYAAGMSGGQALTDMQMVDFATQLGKVLNAEDAMFIGLTRKGFTVSEEQELLLKSPDTSDYERVAILSSIISESWEGIAENMAKTATGRMTQAQNNWGNMMIDLGQRIEPSVARFFDMLDRRIPAIGRLFARGADGLGNFIDRIIPSIGRGIDGAIVKIEQFGDKIQEITRRPEFQEASFFGKVKILWDEIIAKPFGEWWENSGRAWMGNVAHQIGRGIGSAIRGGISALFGIEASGVVEDGMDIGRSFIGGFKNGIEGVDWSEVFKGLRDALWGAVKFAFTNPVTAPFAWLFATGKLLGGISAGYKGFQGLRGFGSMLFGGGTVADGMATGAGAWFPGIAQGLALNKAARGGDLAAQSALTFARGGHFGAGAKMGSFGVGGLAIAGAGVAGGAIAIGGLIDATNNLLHGLRSEDEREKQAYIDAAGMKYMGIATGAAAGAAIGSVIPVVGTLVGGLIGAGVGYLGGKIFGDRRIERFQEEMRIAEEEAKRLRIIREQDRFSSDEMKQAVSDFGYGKISEYDFNAILNRRVMQNIQNRFGDISFTLNEIEDIARRLTFTNATEGLRVFGAATADVANDITAFENASISLRKINWRANIGVEWTQADDSLFRNAVEAMVDTSTRYLQNMHYEAATAIDFLFGGATPNFMRDIDNMYLELQMQINEKSGQIQIILNENDGILNIDQQREVNELMKQISEIINTVNDIQRQAEFGFIEFKYGGMNMNAESFSQLQSVLQQYTAEAVQGFDEAYTAGLRNILAAQYTNPDFDFAAAKRELDTQYHQQIEDLYKEVLGFQIEQLARAFPELDNILFADTKFELEAKLQILATQSLTPAFLNPDGIPMINWNDTQWEQWFGDEHGELAREFLMFFTPVMEMRRSLEEEREKAQMYLDANPLETTIRINLDFSWMDAWRVEETPWVAPPGYYDGAMSAEEYHRAQGTWRPEWDVYLHADGGIMNRAHFGIVAEDGPEAIIPLSANRRSRGLELWERTGQMLGVNNQSADEIKPLAPPGYYDGANDDGCAVLVNVGDVSFDVHIDSESAKDTDAIIAILKANIKSLTDEIAHELAIKLKQVYANLPKGK